jgi:hypothetical protein
MAIRKLLGKRRGAILVAATCTALGIGATLAIQQASASNPTPNIPKISANQGPVLHAMSPNGQAAPAVTATNATCGETITASLTLNGNIVCTGATNGLNVTGKSVVLNLNGFEIRGTGVSSSTTGVNITGNGVTVENGEISNFQNGVWTYGTAGTITKLRASFNEWGIVADGPGNKVTSNEVYSNQGFGIAIFTDNSTVSGNRVSTNVLSDLGTSGVWIGGTKNVVTSNIVTDTQLNGTGIYIVGYDTTVTSNIANFNHADGIVSYDGDLIDGGGNLAKGNDTEAGASPEQCYNIACN